MGVNPWSPSLPPGRSLALVVCLCGSELLRVLVSLNCSPGWGAHCHPLTQRQGRGQGDAHNARQNLALRLWGT